MNISSLNLVVFATTSHSARPMQTVSRTRRSQSLSQTARAEPVPSLISAPRSLRLLSPYAFFRGGDQRRDERGGRLGRGVLDTRSKRLVMDVIRTLVVDDESPARSRLLELLQREPHIKVVGAARDGREALHLIHAQTPHLMFLDIQMPVLDGFGVLQEVEPQFMPVTVFV